MTYSLETETDSFELDRETGLLVVSKELDREAREFYDLTIRQVLFSVKIAYRVYHLVRSMEFVWVVPMSAQFCLCWLELGRRNGR